MKHSFRVSGKTVSILSVVPVVFAMILSGISTNVASAAELSSDPVTLTVQHETGPAGIPWEPVAAAFIKLHPNVTINFSPITNEAKSGSNLQVLSSDGSPDIGVMPTTSNVYIQMVKAKALVPLDGIFAADNTVKRLGPSGASLKQPDGHYYAVPYVVQYYNILWTNPVAIAKAHVKIPANKMFASPGSLIAFAKACNKAGYAGLAIGGKTNFQASWMVDSMLPSAVSKTALNNYINNWKSNVKVTAHYTDPGFVKTLTTLGEFAKQGLYQKGYLGMDLGQATAYFTAGKSCLLLSGSWDAGSTFKPAIDKGTMKFKPSFAVLPPVVAGGKSTLNPYYGDAYAVSAKSKNQAWALELLRYFISDEGQTMGVVKAWNSLAAVTTIPRSAYSAMPKLLVDVIDYVTVNGAQSGWTNETPWSFSASFINPLIQKLQAGSTTARTIAKQQEALMVKVRKNGL